MINPITLQIWFLVPTIIPSTYCPSLFWVLLVRNLCPRIFKLWFYKLILLCFIYFKEKRCYNKLIDVDANVFSVTGFPMWASIVCVGAIATFYTALVISSLFLFTNIVIFNDVYGNQQKISYSEHSDSQNDWYQLYIIKQ